MAVNMQALSASFSNAVQLAVAEAMKAQWLAAPSQDTQSTMDQSVANVVNESLAENTQGTPPRSDIFKTYSVNLRFKTSFFPKTVTGTFNTRHHRQKWMSFSIRNFSENFRVLPFSDIYMAIKILDFFAWVDVCMCM